MQTCVRPPNGLNSIQSGLKAAVAEQTRSERMKVELISNVSHDLKTPLTSILSYSELLMQEPLEGAASITHRSSSKRHCGSRVWCRMCLRSAKPPATSSP